MKKISRVILAALIILSAMLFSSCSTFGGFDSTGTIVVENQSDETIYFLYISSSYASSWGEDVLDDEIIMPGDSHAIQVQSGYYDIQLADFFNVELNSFYDQQVFPGETTIVTYH